jgi:hypothetical protein
MDDIFNTILGNLYGITLMPKSGVYVALDELKRNEIMVEYSDLPTDVRSSLQILMRHIRNDLERSAKDE